LRRLEIVVRKGVLAPVLANGRGDVRAKFHRQLARSHHGDLLGGLASSESLRRRKARSGLESELSKTKFF
jgi:hypothetical protein